MSFFAGVFKTPQGKATDFAHPPIRTAFKLDKGARYWQAPCSNGILVHSQSVVTPEDGWERLPASFERGRKVLVFDGRLDNREELIRTLDVRAEEGAITDSALVSAAITRWNDNACEYLVGDFAFACWDVARRRLFLACDHVGGRTILYHANADRIVFATSVDAMLAFPGVPRDVDLQSITRLLIDAPPDTGSTCFRYIEQLPAAHSLVWSDAGIKLNRYWLPDFATTLQYKRDEDYVDHARELLDMSVRCRLRAVGPIACQLSGGFDSSGVTATAARLSAPAPIFSVTAVPQTGAPLCPTSNRIFVDEWQNAAAVASMHPNLEAHATPAAPPEYADPRLLFHARGMPVRNFLNVSWFESANQAVRDRGAKVLLVGSAGNVTLSWNGIHGVMDLAAGGRLWALRREVMGLSRQGVQRPWNCIRHTILPAIAPAKVRRTLGRGHGSTRAWRSASALSAELALAADAEGVASAWRGRMDGMDYSSSMRLGLFERMWRRPGNSLLRPYYGVERRDPLADVRLVEFCLAIPSGQYLQDGVTRRLARRVLADRVPAKVLAENRIGRQSPDWFHRLTHERGRMAATLERLQKSPLASYALDLGRMKAILDDWPADANAAQPKFGALVSVLARGANVGEFLEWVEGGCAPPS